MDHANYVTACVYFYSIFVLISLLLFSSFVIITHLILLKLNAFIATVSMCHHFCHLYCASFLCPLASFCVLVSFSILFAFPVKVLFYTLL